MDRIRKSKCWGWFLAVIFLVFSFSGCTGTQASLKADAKPSQTGALEIKDLRKVNHFFIFRSDPPGAEIIIIDAKTGKESQTFGKTPVKILMMSKKMEINRANNKIINVKEISANAIGLAYGPAMVEWVEFQFKFRLPGYSDELRIERIPIYSFDSETTVNINLIPTKAGRDRL